MLDQIGQALDAPRLALFELMGADDGSGSALLQALLGIDPNSGLGKYGGLAAEVALDPLNLLGAGAVGLAGKGVNAALDARRAGRVAMAGDDLAAGRRLAGAVDDAAGTFNPATMGPGGFPLGDAGEILPELVMGSKKLPGKRAVPTNPNYPTMLTGGDAARWNDASRSQIRGAMGDLYEPGMLGDYRAGVLNRNADINAGQRAMAFGQMDRPAVTLGDALGADAGMVADAAGRNPLIRQALAAAGPRLDPAMVGDTSALIRALEEALGQASRPTNPLYGQLATMGAGGALGGRVGTQMMG